MAWDFAVDHTTGDMTGGIVAGQDEIVQRVMTRLWRLWGEWFVNTQCGLPWYDGPSGVIPGELSRSAGILGSRNFAYADLWIRNEIAETDGVIRVVDFNTAFTAPARTYSIRAAITTRFGLPYLLVMDMPLDARRPL